MRFWDLVSLIFENLSRRKGRVVLTAVGVVIGTAAVVLLVSLASGLQKSATSNLYGIDDLTKIEVYPNYGGGMYIEGPGGGSTDTMKQLTTSALQEIAAIDGVKEVIPKEYLMGGAAIRYGRLENYSSLMAVDTDDLSNMGYKIDQGSTELRKGTAVVGSWVVQNFYDPSVRPGQEQPTPPTAEDLLNQKLRVVLTKWSSDGEEIQKTINLQVIGILQEGRNDGDGSIFIDFGELTTLNEWFNNGKRINRNKDGYNNVVVKAEDVDKVVAITERINELGFMAYSPQSMVEGINSYFIILQLVFGGIGAIALLVAAIGIANTMTMAILERTKEIGLMKAIGATNRDVLSIFLGEAAGIGFLGGLGGALLGWLGSKVINVVAMSFLASQAQSGGIPSGLNAVTPAWLLIFSIIFATLVGLLSGLYPALRAATLAPMMALKYE